MLHGDIRVNGGQIGAWTAVRMERVSGTDNDPTFRYNCTAWLNDQWTQFDVEHRYLGGGPVLAAKVLLAYAKWQLEQEVKQSMEP